MQEWCAVCDGGELQTDSHPHSMRSLRARTTAAGLRVNNSSWTPARCHRTAERPRASLEVLGCPPRYQSKPTLDAVVQLAVKRVTTLQAGSAPATSQQRAGSECTAWQGLRRKALPMAYQRWPLLWPLCALMGVSTLRSAQWVGLSFGDPALLVPKTACTQTLRSELKLHVAVSDATRKS